jgi:fibronectin type 3 domain-containing protein
LPATDNLGVAHYVVHRDGVVLTTLSANARSYTDGSLDATTANRYYVTALDGAGLEGASSNVVIRSLADATAPTAPTTLARTVSGFTVRLTWQTSTDNVGVTGYTVYRAGVAIGTTTGATTYTDSTAPPGKTYSYTVRARDAIGNLSAASAAVSATLPVDRTAPTAPATLKVTAGTAGSKQLTLTWGAAGDNAGVTSYYVYRGNSKYKLLGKVLTFVDTGLTAGTKYTYKVYAIDASGNWSSPTASVGATAR